MNDFTKYEEFSSQLREHYSPLYGYILSLVHNPDDADDIFQQTALVLWQKYDEFQADRSFRAWACGVAKFKVLEFLRVQRRDRIRLSDDSMDLLTQWQEQAPSGEQARRQEALQVCMQKLSDQKRELLRSYYMGRESARDLATNLGRTVHSIHSSLKHIRQKLHDCIQWRLGDGQPAVEKRESEEQR